MISLYYKLKEELQNIKNKAEVEGSRRFEKVKNERDAYKLSLDQVKSSNSNLKLTLERIEAENLKNLQKYDRAKEKIKDLEKAAIDEDRKEVEKVSAEQINQLLETIKSLTSLGESYRAKERELEEHLDFLGRNNEDLKKMLESQNLHVRELSKRNIKLEQLTKKANIQNLTTFNSR